MTITYRLTEAEAKTAIAEWIVRKHHGVQVTGVAIRYEAGDIGDPRNRPTTYADVTTEEEF